MSNPSDAVAAEYHARCVWLYEKVIGERDVITHVRCTLQVKDVPILDAIAALPAPDPQALEEYWQDTDNPLWAEMQDPAGFERPEYVMRDKLAPWAWSVLDRAALEAEGLAKWRDMVASRPAAPRPGPGPSPAPVVSSRTVTIGGKVYELRESDALTLVGALALAVDGVTASVTLASGDVLELTHRDVSDIGRQLAGKPADEVSG